MRSLEELGIILREMYEGAPKGQKVAHIHLFGIEYAGDIRDSGFTAGQVINSSGLRPCYQTELSKGMNLARYVVPVSRLDAKAE